MVRLGEGVEGGGHQQADLGGRGALRSHPSLHAVFNKERTAIMSMS